MRPLRIFIVDDDRDVAESLAMVFEGRGYDVEISFSGEDAIDRYREKNFDVAFIDIRLPGKNGFESFQEIKKIRPYARVYLITGYSMQHIVEEALKNGIRGVLQKPLDIRNMFLILKNIESNGILIVDDDVDFARSVQDILSGTGWQTFIAHSGQEAIETVCNQHITLLLLDLKMPQLNGLNTYLELKKKGYHIPTIIVTAYSEQEQDQLKQLQSLSIHGVLHKPFDPYKLLLMADSAIPHSRNET